MTGASAEESSKWTAIMDRFGIGATAGGRIIKTLDTAIVGHSKSLKDAGIATQNADGTNRTSQEVLADLAQYYLGEANYAAKQWEAAAKEYAKVLDRYPKSDVTAASRLKYALSLLNLKSESYRAEAKRYLESIQDDFPKTPEAAAASKLLHQQFGEQ